MLFVPLYPDLEACCRNVRSNTLAALGALFHVRAETTDMVPASVIPLRMAYLTNST